jgi:SAM-dependent methyltransferase
MDMPVNAEREAELRERYYPESKGTGLTNVDGTMEFYGQVRTLLEPGMVVVDVGCGRGAGAADPVTERRVTRDLRTTGARAIGLDVDPVAATNPLIDEFRPITSSRWPVDDGSVDVCVSDYVMEHIEDPGAYLREVSRILKPGGHFCFRTPNIHSYFGLLSRMTPGRLKASVVKRTTAKREAQDVFPAFYRFNTIKTVTDLLTRASFQPRVWTTEAEPSYLAFSRFTYALGVLHQRHAPARWRLNIFGVATKTM